MVDNGHESVEDRQRESLRLEGELCDGRRDVCIPMAMTWLDANIPRWRLMRATCLYPAIFS